MLIRLLHQKGIGENVNLEETIGEYECSKVPQALFKSNGSMRQGCKRLEVGSCAERVSFTVPPLPELSQWYTRYVSPANPLVIGLALNAKCRVVLLASANGTIPNVGE